MKALLWLSALANLALGSALIWMHESHEEAAQEILAATLHAEEVHMKIYALALDAIEDPDSESAAKAKSVLENFVGAWEENRELRDELLQAFE